MKYLAALALLNALVVIHELGHWAFASIFRIRVTKVELGIGPPILSVESASTQLALGAIPLGMFLHFEEQLAEQRAPSAWRRGAVLLGGPLFNVLLAILLLCALYLRGTHVPVPLAVGTVQPGSEAARVQIRPGDVLVSVDHKRLVRWRDLLDRLAESPERPIQLEVFREKTRFSVTLFPRPGDDGTGQLGMTEQYVYREHSFQEAVARTWAHVKTLAEDAVDLLRHPLSPSRMVRRAFEVAGRGGDGLLRLTASLSLALAAFYLLPVPGLDGGRLALVSLELTRGKAASPRLMTLINVVGFLAALALCVFLTVAGR